MTTHHEGEAMAHEDDGAPLVSPVPFVDADDEPVDPNAADYDDADEGATDDEPVVSQYGSELDGQEDQ